MTVTVAGRYRLVERLGQGAMGVVWRARDQVLGRDVAVKELLLPAELDAARRAAAAARVLREARAAAALRHPAIVRVHDVAEQDGRPWIVMELLAGRSLEQEQPMAPGRAARIGLDVLAALRAAHERGVLHRDVKPANVFLRDDGRAVLTDFGIATLEGDVSLTRTGALIGTPAYMAPEHARGETGGPPADLWSLGATLYALVEGRTPFARTTVMGTLSAVLTEQPDPPLRAGPLTGTLLALLAKDPAVRLNAQGAEAGLRAVADGSVPPGPVPPVPAGSRPGGPARSAARADPRTLPLRRRRRLPIVAAAAAVGVAGAVVTVVVYAGGGGGGEPVRTPTAAPTGAPRSAPASAAAARFAVRPKACNLLTAEQAGRFVPSALINASADTERDECTWQTLTYPPTGPQYALSVAVRAVPPGTVPPVQAAHGTFAAERARAAPSGGSSVPEAPFEDLTGVGDEAYLTESPAKDGGRAEVHLRVSNVLVDIVYRADHAPGRAVRWRAGAVANARRVVAALPR
ncbi:protein kinase domain-containing protein [Actinomadura scrupuli]|uniref:protein kinase domain-containing protein n=1 Tax=Actinomadura scrupuli TaxID=559629 RepID=UPI003D96FB18